MIVIADTSPINYLILIGKIELLPQFLGKIIIPKAVFDELQAEQTPEIVRGFIGKLPDWIEIRQSQILIDEDLNELDIGEREAIVLAEELKADLLLMDERSGRKAALKRNLPVIGILGILERAAEKNLLDFTETLDQLKRKGFFISPALEKYFLERNKKRKEN